ncbi:MAG TPA: O-antigen ligase family protein [Gammaproteobacteria bacterium]
MNLDAGIKRIAIAMLIYILLFTLLSTEMGRSAKGAYDMLRGMLAFYVGYVLAVKLGDAQKYGLLTVGALVLLAGNFLFPRVLPGIEFYGYFENPNNSAVAIVIFIILCTPLLPRQPGTGIYRALGIVGFVLGVFLLMLTNSRSAWLGLSCALMALVFLLPSVKRRHRLIFSGVLVFILAVVVLLANVKGFSLSERDKIWLGLLSDTWNNRPWLGYGLNRVKDVLAQLGLPTQTAHNLFLEIFVASGLVGLAYMTVFIAGMLRYLFSFRYTAGSVLYMGVMGLICYLVMAQFDLKMSSFTFMASMSLFLGFVHSQRLPRNQG